jgi:uncharacterized protein
VSNDRFEWDAEKAAANLRNHGVAFETAIGAFRDSFGIEWIDDRGDHGEEGVNMLGICEGIVLHVTYTERGDRIRIISARQAERHEQDYYRRENSL